jgi:hypothetical protein
VYVEADRTENGNVLTVSGGEFAPEYDHGVFMSQGGRAMLKNVVSHAGTTLRLGASEDYPLDVAVDGLEVPRCETYLHMVTHVAKSRLTHKNVLLDEKVNVIATDYGIVGNQYRGSRTILGSQPPTEATPGLLNDLYRLQTAPGSGPLEWVCTGAGIGTAAVWKPLQRTEE